jgi:hypothetical protein
LSRLLVNRDGGTSNEYGTFAALGRLFTGDVIEGFQVVPNGTPNMTVLVNPGSGRITTGTYPSSYGYFVSHDTVGGESVTITTAAASPRIDYIVGYVDKSVIPSSLSANVNNTNNIFLFKSVAGTPSGSPVVPTVSQIQTAIGAANPYFILAQVAIAAGVSTITAPNLADKRVFFAPNSSVSLPSNQLLNPIKFSVYRLAALNSAAGDIAVAFDAKLFDTGSNVDIVTNKGRFTAPVAGFYQFSGTAGNSSATATIMRTSILINSALKKIGSSSVPATAGNMFTVSALVQLNLGDYVELGFVGGGGSVMQVGENQCWFTGFLVSTT